MKNLTKTLYYLQNNDKNGNYMDIIDEIEEGILTVTEAKNECITILKRWLDEEVEENFPGNWIVYGGKRIKESVNIPVIGVNQIKEKEQIKRLIDEEHLDFVAIGRAQLADYNFTKHLRDGEDIVTCLECKPCKWFTNGDNCPRHI